MGSLMRYLGPWVRWGRGQVILDLSQRHVVVPLPPNDIGTLGQKLSNMTYKLHFFFWGPKFINMLCFLKQKHKNDLLPGGTRLMFQKKIYAPNPNIFSQGFGTDISRRNSSVFKNLIHKFPKSSIFDVSATKSVHKNVHFHRF